MTKARRVPANSKMILGSVPSNKDRDPKPSLRQSKKAAQCSLESNSPLRRKSIKICIASYKALRKV